MSRLKKENSRYLSTTALSINLTDCMRIARLTNLALAVSLALIVSQALGGCAGQNRADSLYQALGKKEGIENIVGQFIVHIGDDPQIRAFFEDSDLDRFYTKLSEQICVESGGPCQYTGDSMVDVHTKMNVTEADFNRLVDLLIKAMDDNDIPHPVQNRLLSKLAPMRGDIIYR